MPSRRDVLRVLRSRVRSRGPSRSITLSLSASSKRSYSVAAAQGCCKAIGVAPGGTAPSAAECRTPVLLLLLVLVGEVTLWKARGEPRARTGLPLASRRACAEGSVAEVSVESGRVGAEYGRCRRAKARAASSDSDAEEDGGDDAVDMALVLVLWVLAAWQLVMGST